MNKERNKYVIFKTLGILVSSAFLAAISIVCGKYLAIPLGNVMRFSFENLPIILSGIIFGPAVGAIVGTVADLIGCVMVGYTINPIVTLGAASIGALSGLTYWILKKISAFPLWIKITLTVIASHAVGSVIIKTIGLAAFYSIPLWALMLWRLLNYFIVGLFEGLILVFLLKNKMVNAQINSILRKK